MSRFSDALSAVLPSDLSSLADTLGVSVRTIRSWARDERRTDPEQVFALEAALGLPPGELSRHLGYVPLGAAAAVAGVEDEVRRRIASEETAAYEVESGPTLPTAGRLLEGFDVDEAVRVGIRHEILRLVLEDWEAENGPLTEDELAEGRRVMTAARKAAKQART